MLVINRGPAWGYQHGSAPAANPSDDKLPGELINNRGERGKKKPKTFSQLLPKFLSSAGWRAQPSCPEIKLIAAMPASLWMTSAPRASQQSRDAGDRAVRSLVAIIKIHLLRVAGVSPQQLWQLNSPHHMTHRWLFASHVAFPKCFTLRLCKRGWPRRTETGKGHGCSTDSEHLTTADALQNVSLGPLSNPPSTERGVSMRTAVSQGSGTHLALIGVQVPPRRCLALLSARWWQEQGGCGDLFAGMMGRSQSISILPHTKFPRGVTALELLQPCNRSTRAHLLQNLLPARTAKAFGEVFPYCF